jgi:signal transduction histidine kinase
MARMTVRTQLTLLYAGPFLITGAALLTIPILQMSDTVPAGLPNMPSRPAPAPDMDGPLRQLVTASVVGLSVMLVVSFGLGWLIAGRFLRPLRTITATARDISATNLHRRLGLRGRNEFTELGNTLDDLFARLEASFEAQRRFVANASHELRTPLTAERAVLQVALADPEATVDSLRAAGREALSLNEAQERLIDSLLTLASGEQGVERPEPVDLPEVAADVVGDRLDEARRRGIEVRTSFGPARAGGDPRLIESLVANLVDNGLRHNRTGGQVEVVTSAGPAGARIAVGNTGEVVAPDQIGRLFEPFQRLGDPRLLHPDGHGLGLAIVRAIATAHGAVLTAVPRTGGGLDVEVLFPPRT